MSHQFVLVTTARGRKLVRVEDIQEIVPLMSLQSIGDRGGNCRGLANLRAEVVPIFDLNGCTAPMSASRLIVVVRVRGEAVGLIVDDVDDVVSIPTARVTTRAVSVGRSVVVAQLGDEIVTVLEPAEEIGADR